MLEKLDRWNGRTALVTGASSGIGDALARALSGIGMRVAVVARRAERLEALAADIRQAGGEVLVCQADVSVDQEVRDALAAVQDSWGNLDVLVNNAGTANMSELSAGEPEDWRRTLNVNVAAPALFIKEALPGMEQKDEAQIINISSIYAHRDQVPNFSFYQASKFAVRAMTNTLRAEMFAKGTKVRIGMISPGMVATEFRAQATDGAFTYESYFEQFEPILPDIADAALYMLSTPPHVQVQDILLTPMGQGL